MYQNENFNAVGSVETGELVMKLPGTDIRMPYKQGTAYVNATGNVGHLALNVSKLVAEASDEPAEGMMGTLGEMLREQLSTPEAKKMLKKLLAEQPVHLFYSRTVAGTEILTLPGMGTENNVDDNNIERMVVALYTTQGHFPPAEKVYALHGEAVGERELLADRKILVEEIQCLVTTANQVYEAILEVVNKNSLF